MLRVLLLCGFETLQNRRAKKTLTGWSERVGSRPGSAVASCPVGPTTVHADDRHAAPLATGAPGGRDTLAVPHTASGATGSMRPHSLGTPGRGDHGGGRGADDATRAPALGEWTLPAGAGPLQGPRRRYGRLSGAAPHLACPLFSRPPPPASRGPLPPHLWSCRLTHPGDDA